MATERDIASREGRLFINTSNPNKLAEFRRLGLAGIETLTMDLREPDADPVTVIRSKASQMGPNVLVEDTSLDVEGADVGTNVKWLLGDLDRYIGKAATFRSLLGILRGGRVEVYVGEVPGKIVRPRGKGFGFDPVFQPDGSEYTLAEEKLDSLNARAISVKAFLAGRPDKVLAPLPDWDGPWQGDDMHEGRNVPGVLVALIREMIGG
jgi:XTP/dITP diphosphohydrolase